MGAPSNLHKAKQAIAIYCKFLLSGLVQSENAIKKMDGGWWVGHNEVGSSPKKGEGI